MEYQSREDADRAVKQLDGKDLRGRTVRVVADNDVRPLYILFTPFLTLVSSVALITTVGMNVVMTVTVIIVIGIVRSALPTAANARALLLPVVMSRTVDRGLLRVGTTTNAVRPVTKEERSAVPQNPILVRPVTIAAVTKGSGMKRMNDMRTELPGILMAMQQASGKTNAKELPEKIVGVSPFVFGESDYFGDVYMYQTPCGLPISLFSVPWPGTLS